MIILTIKHSDEGRFIQAAAYTMKELIDDKLPTLLPRLSEELPLLKKTARFKKNPGKEEAKEKASGWYYDVEVTPVAKKSHYSSKTSPKPKKKSSKTAKPTKRKKASSFDVALACGLPSAT